MITAEAVRGSYFSSFLILSSSTSCASVHCLYTPPIFVLSSVKSCDGICVNSNASFLREANSSNNDIFSIHQYCVIAHKLTSQVSLNEAIALKFRDFTIGWICVYSKRLCSALADGWGKYRLTRRWVHCHQVNGHPAQLIHRWTVKHEPRDCCWRNLLAGTESRYLF